jgi:ssDNA-binding Zn-finger/Zn-ribbon topoisomerase 1
MRKAREIEADLAKARAAYHGASGTEPAPKLYERSRAIRALTDELAATYTEGAEPCPDCGNPPHGMRKNPATVEVGCLACPSRRAQGVTADEAVERWNRGELVEAPEVPSTEVAGTVPVVPAGVASATLETRVKPA